MHTKNAARITQQEREHLERVRSLPCSVCDASGPSYAHHIKQAQHYTTVALCFDCHQGGFMGIHGQRKAWIVRKMDEIDALAVTIERLNDGVHQQAPAERTEAQRDALKEALQKIHDQPNCRYEVEAQLGEEAWNALTDCLVVKHHSDA